MPGVDTPLLPRSYATATMHYGLQMRFMVDVPSELSFAEVIQGMQAGSLDPYADFADNSFLALIISSFKICS